MNIENIQHKAKKYTEAVKGIDGARQKWQKKVKDNIFKTLETLIKETDIGLMVGINDEKINHETVYLGFENAPSGIEYNPDNPFNSIADRTGVLIKHGGAMYFSFLTNGRVLCWISYHTSVR